MLRLMIVDDEQIIREALSQIIDYESIGYELIATAKNGMEAYDIICDDYPDVVITDIRMPILNGIFGFHKEGTSSGRGQQKAAAAGFFKKSPFSPGTELYYGGIGAPGFLSCRIP